MVALSACNLSFAYKEKKVVSNISFEARTGEVLGLVGPNGSGKTTLIKCIDGILQPEGEVKVFGTSISSLHRMEIAKNIAYVPQSLPDGLSSNVFEAILMGRRPYLNWHTDKKDEKTVFEAMKMLGVEDFAFRKVRELSGGEKQRVMIARAIVQETPIILMDEPTSSLDIRHQMEVMEVIRKLTIKRKNTVLISIHDLNLAAKYCDKMVVLKNGMIHGFGSPAEMVKEEIISEVYGIEAQINREFERPYIIPLKPVSSER